MQVKDLKEIIDKIDPEAEIQIEVKGHIHLHDEVGKDIGIINTNQRATANKINFCNEDGYKYLRLSNEI